MPPSASVPTGLVKRRRRSAIPSRAGVTASSPWLEILGKEQSSSSSSTNRREFFSMYASTALVEITASFFHYASHVSQSEFHFSPRPNRANEIKWRTWSEKAFRDACPLDRAVHPSIWSVWRR